MFGKTWMIRGGMLSVACVLLIARLATAENVPLAPLTDWVEAGGAEFQIEEEARIVNAPENRAAFPRVYTATPFAPGAILEARVEAKAIDLSRGYGAYLTLEHVDGEGKRISFDQSSPAIAQDNWSPLMVRSVVPEGAEATWLCLVVNGQGTGVFRAPGLRVLSSGIQDPAADAVTLKAAATPLPAPYWGMGFEDDGWFYTQQNRDHGADDAAYALREERIRALQPDWIRMFFWYKDWNPSHDWETFTFESEGMESHYRALDIYQSMGTAVMGCGVEWGMKEPFGNPEALARATGALLEHLIRERGYSVIEYWTLTNEPNLSFERTGARFEDYVRIHQLLRAEFDRRGLDVQLVGSDDTNGGENWFQACVTSEAYDEVVGLYASHIYLKHNGRALAGPFFEERLDALDARKPFVVAEFGFQDHRSGTFENPLMRDYDYALWSTRFVIEGFNLGVSGFAIWCLSEMYYPGRNDMPMEYGLWNFGPDWALRPVYSSWKMLSAHTRAGQAVYPIASNHSALAAVRIGDEVFWVNESAEDLAIAWEEGERPSAGEAYGPSQWDAPRPLKLSATAERIILPARSFGRLW